MNNMEDIESLEEKVNIEDLILPSNSSDQIDQKYVVLNPPTMKKREF